MLLQWIETKALWNWLIARKWTESKKILNLKQKKFKKINGILTLKQKKTETRTKRAMKYSSANLNWKCYMKNKL